MKSIEAQKLINKIQQGIIKNGIIKDTLVEQFKELRPYAIAEEDPTLTKVIRLTYEHIDANGSFNIPLPSDDLEGLEDEEGNPIEATAEEQPKVEDDFDKKRESLEYLLVIMADARQKGNRVDLVEYRDMLMAY